MLNASRCPPFPFLISNSTSVPFKILLFGSEKNASKEKFLLNETRRINETKTPPVDVYVE